MPVYVYKNLSTGETFEIEQRITEPALTEHPESGDPVKRLIQPVGIAFKGSGFYVTDSRKSSNGSKGTGGGGEGESKGSSETAGSEAKGSSESASGSGSKDSGKSKSSEGSGSGKSADKPG